MDGVELRRAVPEDAAAIARVHLQSWREAYSHIMSPGWMSRLSADERLERWTAMLAEGASPLLVLVDGEVVGFAEHGASRDTDPPRAHELYSLYLLEAHQGRGLGRALLEGAIGTGPAMLYVLERNERAIGFYRACGFAPDGHTTTLPYWEDVVDVRMVR